MSAFLPIILTVSHVSVAAVGVPPNFDVALTCRPEAAAGTAPGRDAAACERVEKDARATLEQDWKGYGPRQRAQCTHFVSLGQAPSYVELLTCLEMAREAQQLPAKSKIGIDDSKAGVAGRQ